MTHSFITVQKVFPIYSQNSTPTYDPLPVILSNNNLLTLIHDKTKFIIFAGRQRLRSISNINISICNRTIKQEQSSKYLGITITEKLTWHEHNEKLMGKINQRLGLLRRVKSFLPHRWMQDRFSILRQYYRYLTMPM